MKKILSLIIAFLCGCVGIPDNVVPVEDFEVARYLGKWYEIARLDHSFERGLSKVSADYSLNEDGSIKVLNKGFDDERGKWKEAHGRALFIEEPSRGRLKVSFFGPFYGAYNIIELDKENYSYALVCGPDLSYLWILARDTSLQNEIKESLISKAKSLGFETDKLIFVKH
ncbi:MAG: lipocalin [SAR324 cluster bacterium]|uniref:Outer membrane lipoprotein Blc n=1 Tax=SAR324 cluster bacterium TaxID=2024889 RepID=A0A7X9IMF9_9DELT|nr:lipocalin [SAR324 cluster bacterium]